MSLYASKKASRTYNPAVFTDVARVSARVVDSFTEIENVGCWDCKYHPGKYDHVLDCNGLVVVRDV